jgi:hypothetical protein
VILAVRDSRIASLQSQRFAMTIDLPLERMTLADKLEAMELLWADLSRQPSELPSPAWHRDVLDERRRLVAEGKLKFLDWDTAIAELREELRGDSVT